MTPFFDVVVIGGGAAGLSGALLLARSRRTVLVIDANEPRNAPAHAIHGLLSRDGIAPAAYLDAGRAEVCGYGGQVWVGRVSAAARAGERFRVSLDDGRTVQARRLLVATGLVDELPDIPGLRERWGRDVLHCPYCHGWEVRDQTVGVLSTGPAAVHMALLFRQLTADVVLFRHAGPPLSEDQRAQLAAREIRVVDGLVAELEVRDDRLRGVRLPDGELFDCQALVVTPRFVARTAALADLGLVAVEHPLGYGASVAADARGVSVAPGVWVAGNVTDLGAGVVAAAAGGVTAAAAINADLVDEDTRLAERATALVTEEYWDARYRTAEQIWSGKPNPQLVARAAGLSPGTALEVGCGEGADAMWLAARGWHVTAVDVSQVALERAVAEAASQDPEAAERINWVRADALTWDPAPQQFDLVSAQYLHVPPRARAELHRRLAAAVRPGGSLLLVGHHPDDVQVSHAQSHAPGYFFTAEQLGAALDSGAWQVVVAAAPERQARGPEGRSITMRDAVLHARRTGSGTGDEVAARPS